MHSHFKSIQFLLLLFTSWILNASCQSYYLFHLGKEQLVQIQNRQSIEKLLENRNLEPELWEKLYFVRSVREFAIQELALSSNSGFRYYVPLNRDEVGWNVSASYPLEFRSYTWWFPIAGTVPYKGFFNLDMAKEEEFRLKSMGLDTRIRVTGGYSTLGWFSDPIYSVQLKWSKPRIAGLIIHEMAHSTVYIPGESQFNESYANFVENKGLEIFYTKYNFNDPEYLEELKNRETQKKIIYFIKNTAKLLDSIYKSDLPDTDKLIEKQKIIRNFKEQLLQSGLIEKSSREKFLAREWNNEDFIGVLRYKSGEIYFKKVFDEVNQDFQAFHNKVKEFETLSVEEKKHFMEEENL